MSQDAFCSFRSIDWPAFFYTRLRQVAGFKPSELATEAAVTLEPDGAQGFKISRSALTLRAQVPGISAETFSSIARDAERNCPVSKVLKAEITLDAKLG